MVWSLEAVGDADLTRLAPWLCDSPCDLFNWRVFVGSLVNKEEFCTENGTWDLLSDVHSFHK
jgi:hypothetical protein